MGRWREGLDSGNLSLRWFASLEDFAWQSFPLCSLVESWHHPRACLLCVCKAWAPQARGRACAETWPQPEQWGCSGESSWQMKPCLGLAPNTAVSQCVIWHQLEIQDELCQNLQKYVVRRDLLKNLFLNKKNLWRVREDTGKQSLAKGLTAESVAELAVRAGQKSQSFSHWMFSLKANEISRAFKEPVGS